jgi:raffinose/stachyose/melibiose transport system permease protein
VAILSGYAFGVLSVVGEKLLFPLVLLGLMLPMEAFIVPLYYDFLSYRLTDTYQGIILAHLGMGVSFGAFWMRTAFRAVPGSLGEAARIDGAGSWAQLWRVYLPIARPAVLTLVLLSFLWTWNDYFLALVLVSDPAHQPITLGLGTFSGRYLVQINLLSAAAILVSLPIIVLSFVFQRQFIRGILSGSVKA